MISVATTAHNRKKGGCLLKQFEFLKNPLVAQTKRLFFYSSSVVKLVSDETLP